ncbi:hypothetical protein GCM10023094_00450 [Rhodococcus olei]|uniref:Integrase-like protein n=1 Tax=Rhodococcus olei TaxID=2161675 RepID=A0ABP8NTI6_9NOCA
MPEHAIRWARTRPSAGETSQSRLSAYKDDELHRLQAPRPTRRPLHRDGVVEVDAGGGRVEWEVLSRNEFDTIAQAKACVLDWCYGFYNRRRRHSTIGMVSPINCENAAISEPNAA